MVFLTVALVSLYTVVLPFISLYLFKEYDTYHYNQLKSYYDYYTAGYLPESSSIFPSATTTTTREEIIYEATDLYKSIWIFMKNAYKRSAIHTLFIKVSTNEQFVTIVENLKIQLDPFYHQHVVPILNSLENFKLHAMLLARPYYLSVIDYLVPRFTIIKESYISYYADYVQPYYLGYVVPAYEKYVLPQIADVLSFHYKYIHPFYLDHEDKFAKFGEALINFIIGVLIFKIFEKPITAALEMILTDIYDVSQGLDKNYKTDLPNGINETSLIDTIPESEKEPLLAAVREIDSMRPLDNIVDHDSDFTGINKSTTSFNDDSSTKVDIEARPPYSQSNKNQKKGKSKKKSVKKDLNGSFLDDSLAIGILSQNGAAPHVGAQVQVQVIDQNDVIEIQEEIEDELASKGKPNGEEKEILKRDENDVDRERINFQEPVDESDEEEEESEGEEDDTSLENTEEIIKRKLNSVSDSSSDLDNEEKKTKTQLPKVLTDFSTPTKYNTGIFYSSSKNGLITLAIPLTASPTKPAFGILLRDEDDKISIRSSSSSSQEVSVLSINKSAILTNPSPAKPSTARVNEETVFVTNGEAESAEVKKRNSLLVVEDQRQ